MPWADLDHAYGSAADVPDLLRKLLDPDPKVRNDSLRTLYSNVFHQGTRYQATPQVVPFLIEMFYWIVTYLFYRMTKVVSQNIFSKIGIWDVAQENGLRLLDIEQFGWLSFLFPVTEHDVQHWFMDGHQSALTMLNRWYALVHIPGTVW